MSTVVYSFLIVSAALRVCVWQNYTNSHKNNAGHDSNLF